MNRPFMTRPATDRDVTRLAAKRREAFEEGDEAARLDFAEHVIEEGLLGCGIETLTLGMTVGQLVSEYAATFDGKAEVKAWARAWAENEIEAADWKVPA